MAAPAYCPGCGSQLEPTMTNCPNCPMSFPDEEGGSDVHPIKQQGWYAFVLPAAFFAGLGALVWFGANRLMKLGEENSKTESSPVLTGKPASVANARSAAADAAKAGAASAGASAPAGDGAAVSGGAGAAVETEEEPGAGTVMIAAPEPSKPKKHPKEWRLRGTVYDLTTLKPVSGARMAFSDDAADRHVDTRTNALGQYRAIVPYLEGRGYAVTISKEGYGPTYLDPGTEGVREMDAERRKEMARDLGAALGTPPATVTGLGDEPLVTDFYLAPRR